MPADIGPVLRRMRLERDLTLEQLSALSGISDRALSDIERGVVRGPQHRTVLAIAGAMQLSGAARAALVEAARAGRRHTGQPPAALPPLPGGVPDFTGRERELAGITATLTTSGARQVVVTGAPGYGKTTLAVRAAHLLLDVFPDQVFLDLGGTTAEPPSPDVVAHRAIRALQGDARTSEQPCAQLRRVLAERSVLLILDDAADESQVRALRPPPGRSALLVTSRRSLAGLDAAARFPLDRLSSAEARHLLASIIPAEQRTAPDLDRLADLCDHVPLALRIAGNRVASRPGWTAWGLVERLTPRNSRLDALTAGDLRMRAAIGSSVDRLEPATRTLFGRLAVIDEPTFTSERAAALVEAGRARRAGAGPSSVDDMLDELAELNLVEPAAGDSYALRGLLRLYAECEQAPAVPAAADPATVSPVAAFRPAARRRVVRPPGPRPPRPPAWHGRAVGRAG